MNTSFCEIILATLKKCLPANNDIVNLHEPLFCGNEWNYIKECIDSTKVSTVGNYVVQFEKMLIDFTGIKYAIATVNGTAALHICLLLSGITKGDEVIVPALTFVATINAVSYCGAIPHFADSEEQTLGLDPYKLLGYLKEISEIRKGTCFNRITGRPIKAVIAMHTFGHPVDLEPLLELCNRFKLVLIEDATESLGSFYKGRHTGNWGKLSALSFNGNKTITTGGGGAILTNGESLAKLAKHLTTTAKLPSRWYFKHDYIGYNYRLPNINAALGCAQMEKLPDILENKRSLAERYRRSFMSIKGIKFFIEPNFAKSNYWLNVLLLENEYHGKLQELLEITNDSGIMTRPAWNLTNKLPMYKDCPKMDLSVAENIESSLINIPSSAFL